MNITSWKILLTLTCLTQFDCSKHQQPFEPIQSSHEYLVPLAVGNRWTFRVTTYQLDGDTAWTDTIAYLIKSDTIINTDRWFIYAYDGVSSGVLYVRNDASGYRETNWSNYSYSYPYPANVGDSSTWYRVASIDTVLSTPLGLLKCYRYQLNWYGMLTNTYFAPHIGLVRSESAGFDSKTSVAFRSQDLDLVGVKLN
jgi:hypothetical protein